MQEREQAIVPRQRGGLALTTDGSSLVGVAAQGDALARLPEMAFETVKVDQQGNLRQRETQRNRYWRQNLGNGVYLDLMHIPGGVLRMGSPEQEKDRWSSEGPQHWVRVPADFFMGRFPVTQAQWRAIAVLPAVARELNPDPAAFKGANRPVECVSWYDAVEFCARLSQATQRDYRLPTEAEWEYACRAGTTTPFAFGETITTELANYDGNYTYGGGPKGENRNQTTEVGRFPANAWGLYDMHGNVWEWCLDHWHDNYEDKPEEIKQNGRIPWLYNQEVIEEEERSRSLRGGSWGYSPWSCRSAYRGHLHPGNGYHNGGFRVALGLLPRTFSPFSL